MQTKTEEKKQIYEVLILKHDGNHIVALQTDKYDLSFERWNELTKCWTDALKEKIPFVMKEPIITAFDPGLVKEITVRPVIEVPESRYENPYQKKMMKEGLTGMQRGNSMNPNLLDEGYQ